MGGPPPLTTEGAETGGPQASQPLRLSSKDHPGGAWMLCAHVVLPRARGFCAGGSRINVEEPADSGSSSRRTSVPATHQFSLPHKR